MVRKNHRSRYVPALGFHRLTPLYDLVMKTAVQERTFKQKLIAGMNIQPGQRVLDLACGTGTLAIWIKQQHPEAEVIGVDGDPGILEIARNKAASAGAEVEFDQALSHDLPYPDSFFDCLASSLFFHHLSRADKRRTAGEIHRVLKPGADLHLADWGRPANLPMRVLFTTVQVFDGFENTRDHVLGRLSAIFRQEGFTEVTELERFNTLFGTLVLSRATKAEADEDLADH